MNPFSVSGLLIGVACLSMGLWVFLSNPSGRINKLWAVFCVAVAIWGLGSFSVGISSSYAQALISWRLAYVGVIFIPALFYHFVTIFLDLQRKRLLACAYVASFVFLGFNSAAILIPAVSKLFPDLYYLYPPGKVYTLFVLYFISMTVLSHVELYRFLRASKSEKRRTQVRWFFVAIALAFTGGTTCYLPVYGINLYPYGNFCVPLYPIIMSYAIVRHQLMDISIVIRKSLVYSGLVACITSVYLVMVLVTEKWFQGFFGYRSFVATAVVAFLIAVFFNPLRNRIQALVDRALFRGTTAELAEQREQLLTELRKSDQMKSVATLAAGLAHEIKNPLAAIKTFTEYLPQKHQDPEFMRKFERIVGQELDKINATVQNLLTFAKPEALKREPVLLKEVVQETAALLNGDCLKRQVKLEASAPAGLQVIGDRTKLKQALLNLCLNSLDAMEQGGELRISACQQNGHAVLTVVDTGCGISKEHLSRIFDPFFTTKPTGTGLGLSVVQGIVKDHAGRIEAASELGKGTHITVYLPTTS